MSKKNRRRANAAARRAQREAERGGVEVDDDDVELDDAELDDVDLDEAELDDAELDEVDLDEGDLDDAEELDEIDLVADTPEPAAAAPEAAPSAPAGPAHESDEEEWPALVSAGLTKSYGDVPALYPLDVVIEAGQAVALIGHNGSGKSTFLRMVAGLLDATDGEVEVAGWPVGTPPARATTSYLPDEPVLYDDLSVREHIEYVSRLHGSAGYDDYAADIVDRLGLTERVDELPARFSRGLRQKTSIALALVRPFSLLLVDEPFVGLDASGRNTMLELLAEVNRDGAAVVVATHEPSFVERVHRSIALRDGRVVFDGTASVDKVLQLVTG